MGLGYIPGNDPDKIKTNAMSMLLTCLQRNPGDPKSIEINSYFDFHSGCGKYENDWEGIAFKVLSKTMGNDLDVYLHEINLERRKELEKNIKRFRTPFTNINVRGNYGNYIGEYIHMINKNSLVVFDPCKMRNNYDRGYFKDNFKKILESRANIFMYVPEKGLESNKEMINFINDSIIKSSRTGIDLYLNIYDKKNKLKRKDHNIIVTNSSSFTPLFEWHDKALDRIYGGNSCNKGNFFVISSEPSVFSSYHKGYKPLISSK
jgi:hypothetical protein